MTTTEETASKFMLPVKRFKGRIRNHYHRPFLNKYELIKAIYKRKYLWHLKDKDRNNQEVLDRGWKEVAKETGIPRDVCMKKWRGLRDTFKRRTRKLKQGQPTSWVYMEALDFLNSRNDPNYVPEDIIDEECLEQDIEEVEEEEEEDNDSQEEDGGESSISNETPKESSANPSKQANTTNSS